MTVQPIGPRRLKLSPRALGALQALAHVSGLTPDELIEHLVMGVVELPPEDLGALARLRPARPQRPSRGPARVLDLRAARSRRQSRSERIADLVARARSVRARGEAACQAAIIARTRAQEVVAASRLLARVS